MKEPKQKLIITKKLKGDDGHKTFSIRIKDETVERLDEISKKYSFNANPNFAGNDPTLKLEKATYVPKTSQELASIAQTSLSPFKDQSLKEIKKDIIYIEEFIIERIHMKYFYKLWEYLVK